MPNGNVRGFGGEEREGAVELPRTRSIDIFLPQAKNTYRAYTLVYIVLLFGFALDFIMSDL